MNKYDLLLDYSDPEEVINKGRQLGYQIYISTRKNKKYQVLRPDGKFVHFGLLPYEDYSFHHDDARRNRFRNRNWRWADADPFSPAYLSYWLLW
jgi:hypothetical protein